MCDVFLLSSAALSPSVAVRHDEAEHCRHDEAMK